MNYLDWKPIIGGLYMVYSSHIYGMLQPYNRVRLSLSSVNRTEINKVLPIVRKAHFSILPLCSTIQFYFSILLFEVFDLLFKWMVQSVLLQTFCQNTFFDKVYSANYLAVEIWKHDTVFAINFNYYCLLFLMLIKRYNNADFKICRRIRPYLKNMLKVLHYNNF